jgi:uncharacterized protein
MPVPGRDDDRHVTQVILKVAQRCNLNCTYCYVYNRGDDSWRDRPAFISERVARQLGRRIREHCERFGDELFTVELHGGEPLLLGRRRMQRLVDMLREAAAPVRLRFIMQTNGTLLDGEWFRLLERNGISFGVSLDGPAETADRYRVMRRRRGGGSTQTVLDNLATLREQEPGFDDLFGGCLAVIHPEHDGAELVRWFVDQDILAFDILLPDGNRVNPPDGWTGPEPYRRFLLEAFDEWYAMENPPRMRLFEEMLMGLLGRETPLDALGGDLRRLCVIESDGSIGVSDVARICGGDLSRDTLDIFRDRLEDHVEGYSIDLRQKVCATCDGCPHLASCGGGYLPHRFDGRGFDNPSIYCEALYALSDRMVEVLRRDVPDQFWVRETTPMEAA